MNTQLLVQLVPLVVWTLLLGVPLAIIVQRLKLNLAFAIAAFFPIIGPVICLWVIALMQWPVTQPEKGAL